MSRKEILGLGILLVMVLGPYFLLVDLLGWVLGTLAFVLAWVFIILLTHILDKRIS